MSASIFILTLNKLRASACGIYARNCFLLGLSPDPSICLASHRIRHGSRC